MILEAPESQWWSATATWRLLRCPASAAPASAPARPIGQTADNPGAIAHLALQRWIEAGEWSSAHPGTRLQERFDEVAKAHEAEPARMRQGIVTRARLPARGQALSEILASVGSRPQSEVLLRDDDRFLFGVLDIVSPGGGGLIIDLKTGRNASAALPPAIYHQMTFYTHLFQVNFGAFPERVLVFSLQRGLVKIPVTSSDIAPFLGKIHAAQGSDRVATYPRADICRYCPKRMGCQPHWDAISAWDDADAIEGEVAAIEYSSSGTAAVQIGGQWLTGISATILPSNLAPGQFARAVRVRRGRGNASGDWSASSRSRLRILPEL